MTVVSPPSMNAPACRFIDIAAVLPALGHTQGVGVIVARFQGGGMNWRLVPSWLVFAPSNQIWKLGTLTVISAGCSLSAASSSCRTKGGSQPQAPTKEFQTSKRNIRIGKSPLAGRARNWHHPRTAGVLSMPAQQGNRAVLWSIARATFPGKRGVRQGRERSRIRGPTTFTAVVPGPLPAPKEGRRDCSLPLQSLLIFT